MHRVLSFITGVFTISSILNCTTPSGRENPNSIARSQADTILSEAPCMPETGISFLEDRLFNSPLAEFEYISPGGNYVSKLRAGQGAFGVLINPGIFLAAYAADSAGTWRRTYCTVGYPDLPNHIKSRRPDINFDGHSDLVIDHSFGGYGNDLPLVFLFDSLRQTFGRDTALELENLSIDRKKKQLRSRHYSSVCGASYKLLYGWQNDSLILLGEAVLQGCLGAANDESRVEWFERLDGRVVRDSLYGKKEVAAEKFDRLLWRGQ
jgi:hypothetical protein